MKKTIKFITIICLFIIITMTSFGCSLFAMSDDNGEVPTEENITITIINDTQEYTQQVVVGEIANVDLPIKAGYVCIGLFSDAVEGTKYFDGDGESITKWQKNFPTKLYAQFKYIIGLTYTSEIDYEEEPIYISFYKSHMFYYELSDEFKVAINSNTSLKVKITAHYDIIGESTSNAIVTYISSTDDTEGLIESYSYNASFYRFQSQTLEATCVAKQLTKQNKIFFQIRTKYGYENYRIKNIYCTAEILAE